MYGKKYGCIIPNFNSAFVLFKSFHCFAYITQNSPHNNTQSSSSQIKIDKKAGNKRIPNFSITSINKICHKGVHQKNTNK